MLLRRGRVRRALSEVFHMFFRHYNFPCELGLHRIGNPSPKAPVFLSGNYTLVVDRLRRVLEGMDCYLLVASSKGSNVWCAAGMNEFNEHDVIDAIVASELAHLTTQRTIIAPPYAAPGINVKAVHAETGFRIKWGPMHLKDIPKFTGRGFSRTEAMTKLEFGIGDRIAQALSNSMAYSMTLLPAAIWLPRYFLGVVALVYLVFLFWYATWNTAFVEERYRLKTLATALTLGGAVAAVGLLRRWSPMTLLAWEATAVALVVLAAMDGTGGSVLYKTTVRSWLRRGDYQSLFSPVVDPALCRRCGECLLVCPKQVLARADDGAAVSVAPAQCVECLACVKQCEPKAFFNRSGRFKGDVKSIDGIAGLMTRSWAHLRGEDRWVGSRTEFRKGVPHVVSPVKSAAVARAAR